MEQLRQSAGQITSTQEVKNSEERQYHIATAPGEVAEYILLCGDPDRANRVAKKFDSIEVENRFREFVTITGSFQGQRMSVCATGIGCDNMEIVLVELAQCVSNPTFLRIGSCGALQAEMQIGELVISTGAVRLEDTSLHYVPPGYPAVAHYQIVQALIATASQKKYPYHVGISATCSGFYGAQGRAAGKYKPREPEMVEELSSLQVRNMEMEISTLFTLSSIQNFRAGAVCTVFTHRLQNQVISMDQKKEVEDQLIDLGLHTIIHLCNEDQKTAL